MSISIKTIFLNAWGYLCYSRTQSENDLVDQRKYLIFSTKLFRCFNQIGIFGRLNQIIDLNHPKFAWFNKIFMNIHQNNFVGFRIVFSCCVKVYETDIYSNVFQSPHLIPQNIQLIHNYFVNLSRNLRDLIL